MSDKETTKEVLRLFNYGLYVASAIGSEGVRAATLSWVVQASFEPRLIVAAVRRGTAIHEAVLFSRRFVLHVVGQDQQEFAKAFFKVSQSGPDQVGGYRFSLSESGLPVFAEATAWLECEVLEEAGESGDHAVIIAQISDAGLRKPAPRALALRDTPWHYGG